MALRSRQAPLVPFTQLQQVPAQRRVQRRPQHSFAVRFAPWTIQPFAIAPVLPGETLERALIQARVVTDPLVAKLRGWWCEMHVFYVKHRDLAISDKLQAMALNPYDATGFTTVAGSSGTTYRLNGRLDFVRECLNVVTDWFFRDEGTSHADHVDTLSGLPFAKIGKSDWMDSMIEGSLLTSEDVALPDTGLTASAVEVALRTYDELRQNQLIDMTYEDFLATYGIRPARATAVNRPELLRSIRDFQFPANTVTQGTGAVTSAVVWSIDATLNKKRLFLEPGFVFAVIIAKPKVFWKRQVGAAVNMLDTSLAWLPAVLRDDPATSLLSMDTTSGALSNASGASVAGGMVWDARDLFLYGDQFLAARPSVAGGDTVAAGASISFTGGQQTLMGAANLPDTVGTGGSPNPDYPTPAMTTISGANGGLFVSGVNEAQLVQADGIMTLEVNSLLTDVTLGTPNRG